MPQPWLKTCANSLRVGFVDRILPDARFLFIIRDGRDAAASAMNRFKAPLDTGYTLKKLRYFPLPDCRYMPHSSHTIALPECCGATGDSHSGVRASAGSANSRRSATLGELCARQWRECVEVAAREFALIDPARVLNLRYEDLVRCPHESLVELSAFLGAHDAASTVDFSHVSSEGIGRGRERLQAPHGGCCA